jgi:hypothetical protein
MKNILPLVSWISGTVAAILILFGLIAFFFHVNLFGVGHAINYFHAANSLFLLSICSLIYRRVSEEKEK